jgi:hypothetical protein
MDRSSRLELSALECLNNFSLVATLPWEVLRLLFIGRTDPGCEF